ncbi:hypothetical protein L218DRAFT_475641 [Marasmius fiardii PR-910]|nr:hypothetical protein L218DRAFT_475641 [Marasmius fiardii PR-910]
MDVDVNPSTLSTSTTTSRPLSAKEDVPMDINAELEMSSIRSTIGATVAGTEEQVVLVASSSTRAPAPMAGVAPRSGTQPMDVVVEDQGQGRVTRSAAQRANKRSRPVTHGKAVTEENKELATKRRTRASTRVAGSTKGKEKVRAVEVEPESDVEMTEDKEADDDDGSGDYRASRAGRSSKVANTRNKIKRGIATVQPEAPATGETEGSGSGVTGVAPDLEAPSQVAAGSTRGRGRPRGRPRKATKKRGG